RLQALNLFESGFEIIHQSIFGKASFAEDALMDNFKAAFEEIQRLKPSASKGRYIQKAAVSTTFGPGIPLDVSSL
ncbi:MAG: hypothetical protein HN760_04780, partial [Microbacteriaceae bacterium]|nr:hypothetical protein [Microbacteriaceae bacterium]